jgi:hypothetical protein
MIDSMLEPHMKHEAGSTQGDVGMAFFILGGIYMVISVAAGHVSCNTIYSIVCIRGSDTLNFVLICSLSQVPQKYYSLENNHLLFLTKFKPKSLIFNINVSFCT